MMISETHVDQSDGVPRRIGAVLERADGTLFAAVSAGSLSFGQAVCDDGTSRRLGVYVGTKQGATFLGDPAATDLIGLVRLDPDAALPGASLDPQFKAVAKLSEQLGRPVIKLDQNGLPSRVGRLTSVLSTIRMSDADGDDRRYFGALEIQSDDPEFAVVGDAGASIVAEDGSLLGTLVAKAGDVAIAVPYVDILECFGLTLARPEALAARRLANREDPEGEPEQREAHKHGADLFRRPLATFYGGQSVLDGMARQISFWPSGLVPAHPLVHGEMESLYGYDPQWHPAVPNVQGSRKRREPRPGLLERMFDGAPRTSLRTLSDKLREEPTTVIEAPGLVGVPLNYVAGLEPALSELKLKRQEFAIRLMRYRPKTESTSEAFDLFHQHFDRIKSSELRAIAYGRAVSMETVLICIVVVDGIAESSGVKVPWDDAYVEPAVFAMEDDRGELSDFLQHERGAWRAVEESFRQWSEMAPVLKGRPVAKLVDEAVKGHAMRFRTARFVDASVSPVFGRPLKWRAVHEGQQHVIASATEDRIFAQG